ncbi:MAG: ABC transporter ATP-binding protein [Candidatus Lokiarchaeota archaeon]|nr:ABC transporter ATP-binding protein [Candidatus Lokiarchaeota archaeon]
MTQKKSRRQRRIERKNRRTDIPEEEQRTWKYKDYVIIKRLFNYILKYKRKITVLFILSIIVSLTGLAFPLLMYRIIGSISAVTDDPLLQNQAWNEIWIASLILLGVVTFNLFLKWIYQRNVANLSLTAISDIRTELFSHIQTLSLKYYSSRPSGKILSTLSNDVDRVNNLISNAAIQIIADLLTVVIAMTLMMFFSWRLTFLILGFVPVLGIIFFLIARKAREYWRRTRQTISIITSLLQETIQGSRTIKAFVTEQQNIESFQLAAEADRSVNLSAARLQAFLVPFVQIILALIMGTILIVGSRLVDAGDLTIPELVSYFLLVAFFIGPLGNLVNFYNTIQLAMAAGERILTILDTKPQLTSPKDAVYIDRIEGNIEFQDLSFSYEKDIPVLKEVNLKVSPNQSIAFVGFTGAGKTTLISLLARFYDPTEGRILIDGIDIRKIDPESLRNQMAIVLQDTYLFSGTVMENIRYGKPDATDKEILKTTRKLGAHKFIMKLVNGYETEVRERGTLLSVGQRQLISFARALIANPRILILDEATSSVDPYTELKIQEALKTLLENRNSFIIAHRLSTVLNADLICVLENGRIIQIGTHEELVKNKEGLYNHLYEMQFTRPSATFDELEQHIVKERRKKFART